MEQETPKIYETIVMEVRSRLQSVNVYIALKEKTSDFDVTLNHNNLSIVVDGVPCSILCTGLNFLPDSLSSLQINGRHVSFRLQTNNAQGYTGRFKAELLQQPKVEKLVNKTCSRLKKNVTYSLHCSNCLKPLTKNVSFRRVLPLPSENIDVSSWFCHASATTTNVNLDASDVFYTETYVHFANSLLGSGVIKSEKITVCGRCLFWLGLKVDDLVVRLWFNMVTFKQNDDEILSTSSLSDVNAVTNEILNHSFLNTAKIIFHCQVTDATKNYILLWVVEKKLNLLVDVSKGITNCDVAKVLFKFEEQENETVLEWQKETMTTSVSVSKLMMVDLLKHLHKINKIFPKDFRVTNGFLVSYLCLYDSDLF